MSAPVRFLGLVIVGWAVVRTITVGAVPGFTFGPATARPVTSLPPIMATQFAPLPPVDAETQASWPELFAHPVPAPRAQVQAPFYYPSFAYPELPAGITAIPPRPPWRLASVSLADADGAAPVFFDPIKPIEEWDLARYASAAFPPRRSAPAVPVLTPQSGASRLDRLQMSSWALLRGDPSPGGLASGGTFGGSQAGARLTYAFNRWLAASVRTSSPLGGSRGAEVAAGVRVTPFRSVPLAVTAERRQSISRFGGGRSAFALYAESGLYQQPLPLNFSLDAYLQAGVVGVSSRDLFADGAAAVTRPVWGRFSAGFGVWGGAQPGLYRLDAGPRVSVRLRDNVRAHVDWRQRLAGSAAPASGPALTLAADF